MKISKSILEAALGLVSQKIAPHSPQGNYVVEADAHVQAKLHAEAQYHKKAAEKLTKGSRGWHAAMAAHHEAKAEYYHAANVPTLADRHGSKAEDHLDKMHEELDESLMEEAVTVVHKGEGGHHRITVGKTAEGKTFVSSKFDTSGDPKKPSGHGSSQSLANYVHSKHGDGTAEKSAKLHSALVAAHATGDKKKVLAAVKAHGYSHHDWKLNEEEELQEAITPQQAKAHRSAAASAKDQAEQHKMLAGRKEAGSPEHNNHTWAYHERMMAHHQHLKAAGEKGQGEHIATHKQGMKDHKKVSLGEAMTSHQADKKAFRRSENDDDGHVSAVKYSKPKHFHEVPYKDKEHAKGEGMRWDNDKRKWYHTDAGKSATSKFRKLTEEEMVVEAREFHTDPKPHSVEPTQNRHGGTSYHVKNDHDWKRQTISTHGSHADAQAHADALNKAHRELHKINEEELVEAKKPTPTHIVHVDRGGHSLKNDHQIHVVKGASSDHDARNDTFRQYAHSHPQHKITKIEKYDPKNPAHKHYAMNEEVELIEAQSLEDYRKMHRDEHENGGGTDASWAKMFAIRAMVKKYHGKAAHDKMVKDTDAYASHGGSGPARLKEEEKKPGGGFDHRKAAMAGVMHSDDHPHMKPNMQHDFYSSKNGDKIQGTVHTVTKDRVIMKANKQHHKDHGKFHTFKFAKSYDRMNEEVLDEETKVAGHRFAVTISDPNHTAVSQRDEKVEKFINVKKTSDKFHASALARAYYKRKGYKVHDVQHHSALHEDFEVMTEEHATREQAEKRMSEIEKKHPMAKHTVMQGRRSGKWHVVRHTSGGMHVIESEVIEDCGLESKADLNSKKQVGLATSGIDKDASKKFASIVKSTVKQKKETK